MRIMFNGNFKAMNLKRFNLILDSLNTKKTTKSPFRKKWAFPYRIIHKSILCNSKKQQSYLFESHLNV